MKENIDFDKYCTAKEFAEEMTKAGKPTTPQMVTNWKNRGLVQFEHFPSLGKDLIIRGTLNLKTG